MKRYYLIYQGHVQGVGFRAFVQIHALKYNCTGYARNMDNGHVEIEIQGEEKKLDQVFKIILEGNQFIHIEDYSIKEIPCIQEMNFNIRY